MMLIVIVARAARNQMTHLAQWDRRCGQNNQLPGMQSLPGQSARLVLCRSYAALAHRDRRGSVRLSGLRDGRNRRQSGFHPPPSERCLLHGRYQPLLVESEAWRCHHNTCCLDLLPIKSFWIPAPFTGREEERLSEDSNPYPLRGAVFLYRTAKLWP